MNQVIVFPRGQLTPEDKASIREMGVVAVEADDPKQVVVIVPTAAVAPILNADDLTMAAMGAVGEYDATRRMFVQELHRRMVLREEARDAGSDAGAEAAL